MVDAYRVLVVDDDADVALYTKTVLERRGGCVVRAVGTAEAARAAATEFRPDVVVTDIEMPGMSGLDLIAALREANPRLPVVVVTAHVSVDYAVGALQSQANEFLTKPVNSSELLTVVQRLAAESRVVPAGPTGEVVLAVAAHPDDIELGAGGTLTAHRDAGDTIVLLTASRGEGDRTREAQVAASMLGARLVIESFSDSAIVDGEAVPVIERVVAEVSPSIVYTHSSHDRQHTHRAVHEATIAATRAVPTVACFQSGSSTVDFRPTRFVPIDLGGKLALLAAYEGVGRADLDAGLVAATARYWSRFGSADTVEPFEIIREAGETSMPIRRRDRIGARGEAS